MILLKDECLICGKPLIYLDSELEMECAVCKKKEKSNVKCAAGHYVCNDCHMSGVDSIIGVCQKSSGRNPVKILSELMALPFCHMHGPEHHIMVGASLLTAYKNSGADIDLPWALTEMYSRGKKVPGGVCGFWGACGAGISSGMFISIATGSTPLKNGEWGLSNKMTAHALNAIGEVGGPRCCKRDSYLAITEAVKFAKEHLGVQMELEQIICEFNEKNNQCIKERCPFYKRSI